MSNPENHTSYSAISLFLNNRLAWHTKYVLGERDQKTGPAALTGSAFHKHREMTLVGQDPATCIQVARQVILDVHPDFIDWGKTGSSEKCLDDLDKLIANYARWPLPIGKVLDVERGETVDVKGIKMPITAYIDLAHEQEGELKLVDWKTCRSFDEELSPKNILQAVVYYWIAEAIYGRKPYSMTFFYVKPSVDREGGPSTHSIELVYKEHPEYLKACKKLVKDCLKEMKRKNPLPNLTDDYDGPSSFQKYLTLNS